MATIHLLDESIAQKIAAGEVVERPASVIKELIENSIDAGSTFITVEIREGGVEHIRVTDNGCGIPDKEVELAFLRHATSKIQCLQDLYNITQMGFRGEALYSIAAVSKLELTTKPAEQTSGVRFTIHGGKRVSIAEHGCPDGTTIIANELFFNTPARLNFLNKPGVEAGYVGTVVTRHILANPGISIKFINNDKVIYHSAGDGSLKNAIYTIFGREVAQGLLPVKQDSGDLSVEGYLFAPGDAFANRSRQMLMINNRPVNNIAISSIVERVYSGMADSKKFPGYVLNIHLPPAEVDVNVHPNKLQVRFANEYRVKQAVEIAVSRAMEQLKNRPLQWAFLKPEPDDNEQGDKQPNITAYNPTEKEKRIYSPSDSVPSIENNVVSTPEKSKALAEPAETIGETVDRYKDSVRSMLGQAGVVSGGASAIPMMLMQKPTIQNTAILQKEPEQVVFSDKIAIRTIGQLFDTYALLEVSDRLLIIDQHAAHERLLYERFREKLRNTDTCSQKLLIAQVINVSFEDKAVLDANLDLLESLGFEVEEYGRLTYQVRAVPFILGQPQVQDFIFDLLEILSDDRTLRTEELKKEKVMSMACKKAVKGGDRLSTTELAALVDIINTEAVPLTCPHGRPFVIILDRRSMEKQFRRSK